MANHQIEARHYYALVFTMNPRFENLLVDALNQIPGLRLIYRTCDALPLKILRRGEHNEI